MSLSKTFYSLLSTSPIQGGRNISRKCPNMTENVDWNESIHTSKHLGMYTGMIMGSKAISN